MDILTPKKLTFRRLHVWQSEPPALTILADHESVQLHDAQGPAMDFRLNDERTHVLIATARPQPGRVTLPRAEGEATIRALTVQLGDRGQTKVELGPQLAEAWRTYTTRANRVIVAEPIERTSVEEPAKPSLVH